MTKAYTTEEAVNYCTRYVQDGNAIGLLVHQHEGRTMGMGCTGRKVRTDIEYEIMQEAHHGALNQLVSMDKWVEQHLNEICCDSDGRTEAWV
jgi:hypothetical protein